MTFIWKWKLRKERGSIKQPSVPRVPLFKEKKPWCLMQCQGAVEICNSFHLFSSAHENITSTPAAVGWNIEKANLGCYIVFVPKYQESADRQQDLVYSQLGLCLHQLMWQSKTGQAHIALQGDTFPVARQLCVMTHRETQMIPFRPLEMSRKICSGMENIGKHG